MTTAKIITTILTMLAGLAVFMFGLKTMSERLEKQAGNKVRTLFSKATNNKYMGLGVGAGVTAIIQSSSATTVMVVGFVNAGILSLTQATAVIMGANIGTTITAVIISLPVAEVVAACGLIGVFMIMFSERSNIRNIGYIVIALGMIFTGLSVMGGSMKQFAALDSIKYFFATTTNPLLLIIIGALVTALIQSSSATTGILITLSATGLMGIDGAIFIILGINVGTCITAIFASIGANVNAHRAAAIHLMFNITGTIIFAILLSITPIRTSIVGSLSNLGSLLPNEGIGAQIAAFHIIFNVATTLALLPFINLLVTTATKIFPDKQGVGAEHELKFVNELMLESPPIAVAQAKQEILRMAEMAKSNLDLAIDAVSNRTLKNYDDFMKMEKYLDWLNQEIPYYLTRISAKHISFEDEVIIGSYYHVVSDIERIGDYAENLMDYTERMIEDNTCFSEQAIEEIRNMYNTMQKLYDSSIKGFTNVDISMLKDVEYHEDKIDEFKLTLSNMHIKRLNDGICSAQSGALFLSLISNLERIADHMRNIYNSIRKYTKEPMSVSSKVYYK